MWEIDNRCLTLIRSFFNDTWKKPEKTHQYQWFWTGILWNIWLTDVVRMSTFSYFFNRTKYKLKCWLHFYFKNKFGGSILKTESFIAKFKNGIRELSGEQTASIPFLNPPRRRFCFLLFLKLLTCYFKLFFLSSEAVSLISNKEYDCVFLFLYKFNYCFLFKDNDWMLYAIIMNNVIFIVLFMSLFFAEYNRYFFLRRCVNEH